MAAFGLADSARGGWLRLNDTAFASENRAFLTRPDTDATYYERPKCGRSHTTPGRVSLPPLGTDRSPSANPSRPHGSPLRQRILRVAMDVHNNKEVGP